MKQPLLTATGIGLFMCLCSCNPGYNDLPDGESPQLVKQISNGWYLDVIPYNNTLICQVQEGLTLYDISKRLDPILLTNIK